MKKTKKYCASFFIIFIGAGLFFSFSEILQTRASFGGLDNVTITGENEITVTYVHTLDNNVYTSYSNLGGALSGREITGGVGNTGDNYIVLTFNGPPVPANTTGTIDIDTTVTWDVEPGGFGGADDYEVLDGQQPSMFPLVKFTPPGFSGITKLYFFFNEPIATSSITTSNIDSALGISDGHTFGTEGNGLSLSWNNRATRLEVSLGSDATIEEGDTTTLSSGVTDIAGNQATSYADATISFVLPTPRNLYFNADVSNSWSDVGNWWDDEAFTVPASSVPNLYDSVYIYGNVSSYFGNPPIVEDALIVDSAVSIDLVVFNPLSLAGQSYFIEATLFGDVEVSDMSAVSGGGPGSYYSSAYVIGDATFNAPTTANYGTIFGDTTFSGEYGNAGLIFGNVEFNGTTTNPGTIYGNVVFRDNTANAYFGLGLIYGDADVYYPAENPLSGTVSGTITYHGYDNPFDGGSGTSGEDPYLISTCTQLQLMDDYLDSNFQLTQDIDCSESATWNINLDEFENGDSDEPLIPDSYASVTNSAVNVVNNGYFGFNPIGDDETPFTGRLDGDGYTISNLWIFRKAQDNIGLFGETSDAHILRLGLSDSSIVGRENTGGLVGKSTNDEISDISLSNNMVRAYLWYYGGGLVGRMVEGVEAYNITNSGGTVHGSGSIIGGIVGYMYDSHIYDSSSSADVDGGDQIGGFVGSLENSFIEDSTASGNVVTNRSEGSFVKSGNNAGGFVGYMNEGQISDSNALGNVDTTGNYAGGFAGSLYNGTITRSYATGDVTGIQEDSYPVNTRIGGFVGDMGQATTTYSYATGNVISSGDRTGGFSGSLGCESDIRYSYATGDVQGVDLVGGFTGDTACQGTAGIFQQVYATGNVTGTNYVGGFGGGLFNSNVLNAYASSTVTGSSYVGGFAGELNYTDVDNVYSRSVVASLGDEFIGSFVGKSFNDGEPTEGFWDNSVAFIFSDCGTGIDAECIGVEGKSAIQMTTKSTFEDAGYDFDSVWTIDEQNQGYPYFTFGLEPIVLNVIPARGATNVNITAEVAIQFSQTMNTAVMPVITSGPCDDSCPSFDVSWSDMDTALVLTKSGGPFAYGTTYTINVNGARSEADILVEEYEWSFTTENEPAPPVVKSRRSGSGFSSRTRAKNLESWGNTTASFGTPTSTYIPTPPTTNLLVRDLKLGLSGADVKALQTLLIAQGFAIPAGPTGYFGAQTKAALSLYQAKNGIAPAIGYFGPKTRAQMKMVGVGGLWW